eukprot:GFUD01004722.1.p1 GENE.GFUD01004722.1~~GFUD01004722.1.p1  ORF type:complete len:704 (+),score=141.96 GFUD01004722.1:39-2150(+)
MLSTISMGFFLLRTISGLILTEEICNQCKDVSPTEENKSFYEGENVTLLVEGDFGSEGCKVLFHQKLDNVTCCYIDERRDHHIQYNKTGGERLCGRLTEPESCRKRDTYEVREVDGWNGWCKMTLFDGKKSDSGEYQIIFPGDPESNTKRTIEVNKYGLYRWEIVLICLTIVVFIILSFFVGRFRLKQIEVSQRRQDGQILDLLRKEKNNEFKKESGKRSVGRFRLKRVEETQNSQDGQTLDLVRKEFKEELGKRNVLGLRDRNYNNIFHLAAGTDWTEKMTKTVLEIVTEKEGSTSPEEGCLNRREDVFSRLTVSSGSEWISDWIPNYMIPKSMLPLTINLNTRNVEGNTPLIIASIPKDEKDQKDQMEVVKMLVGTEGVKLDIQNDKKYTALHMAVLKKNINLVKLLLEKGASQETSLASNSCTPLHTAVDESCLEIVELLVTDLEKNKSEWVNKVKKGIIGIKTPCVKFVETPLYLALKSSHYTSEDIAKHLIENGFDIAHENDKKFAVYDLVAAGKQAKLNLLIKDDKLKWEDYNKFCLQEAVERNHTQAVGNIYKGIAGPKPDHTMALQMANKKILEMNKIESSPNYNNIRNDSETTKKNEKPSDKMSNIIKKIMKEAGNDGNDDEDEDTDRSEIVQEYSTDGAISAKVIKEKKTEFYKYVSKLKNKKNGDWWLGLSAIIEQLQEVDRQVKELNQRKV